MLSVVVHIKPFFGFEKNCKSLKLQYELLIYTHIAITQILNKTTISPPQELNCDFFFANKEHHIIRNLKLAQLINYLFKACGTRGYVFTSKFSSARNTFLGFKIGLPTPVNC